MHGEVMKPHKHAELIKAWADGAEIESRNLCTATLSWEDWKLNETPNWSVSDFVEFRIKPTPIKLDIVVLRHLRFWRDNLLADPNEEPNIKFVFDGETKKVKSAEVLK